MESPEGLHGLLCISAYLIGPGGPGGPAQCPWQLVFLGHIT
jgi:hypothetical protein